MLRFMERIYLFNFNKNIFIQQNLDNVNRLSNNPAQVNDACQLNLLKNAIFLKTWKLAKAIHVKLGILLTSLAHGILSCKSSNILGIQANNRIINNADDMAEAFNAHFTNIAKMLARDIPVGEVDAESFLSPSDNSFSLKPPSVDIVLDLLKKFDEKKPTGLDEIPSKLLKMAESIVVPVQFSSVQFSSVLYFSNRYC